MAQLLFNIPDAVTPRVLDAMASKYNYDIYYLKELENNKVPLTKIQFVKMQIIQMFKNAVADYESRSAIQNAADSAKQSVETDIKIT